MKKTIPLSRVYQILEPGPVVLVTTSYRGRANVMTMSWHMMIDFEPPIVGCIISDQNYTFDILKKTKECVINIPTADLAAMVVAVGNVSGRDVDKFEKFHLAKEPALQVKAPLLTECCANLECRVIDMKMVKKYNMFILEVVQAWGWGSKKRALTLHHQGFGTFVIDGKVIELPSGKK